MLVRALCAAALVLALVVPLAASLPGLTPAEDPAQVGRWLAPFDAEIPAVTMAVLSDGRVLYWSGAMGDDIETVATFLEAPKKAVGRILDLSSGAPAITPPTPEDLAPEDVFCAGQSFLQDGRLLAAGGTRYAPIPESGGFHLYGVEQTVAFDPTTDTFSLLDEMAFARWYPTVLTLPDGDALAFGGTEDLFAGANVAAVERYDAGTNAWSVLPAGANNLLPTYPHVQRVPSGPYQGDIVYLASGCLSCTNDDALGWYHIQTLDLDAPAWTQHGATVARDYPASVLLPLRPPAYDARFLVLGGGVVDAVAYLDSAVGVPTADIIDMTVAPPAIVPTAPMANPRFFGHGLVLPTGDVLAVGGTLLGAKPLRQNPGILPAEIYDPEADAWTTLDSLSIGRGYHSTAVLLPDARVLVGGYVPLASVATDVIATPESTFEIFEPPYLFQGDRPVIDAAPTSVSLGETIAIGTTDTDASVVLVRPGAVTHVIDTEQRLVELEGTSSGSGIVAAIPDDTDLVMPGWWMLFLVDDGVPSVAKFIHVEP